jgi:hypothetical protein
MKNPSKLSARIGCPFALVLTSVIIAAVEAARAHILERPWSLGTWDLATFVTVAAPFGILAVARTRDWVAWFLALTSTAALWGWFLYDLTLHNGFNFAFGPVQMFLAPLLISGFCLSIAGVRGNIPDWGVDSE